MTDTSHSSPHPDVAAYLLESLDPQDIELFEQHLATCDTCRQEKDELERAARSIRSMPEDVDVPDALKSKTIAAIRADRGADNVVSPRPDRARFRPFVAVGAVAAAIAIFITGVNVGSGRHDNPGLELTLTSTTGGAEHGSARLSAFHGGSKIALDVRDIEPSPDGMHYEVVVTRPGAEMTDGLSAGTFRMDRTGDLQMVMMTAEATSTPMTLHVVLRSDTPGPLVPDEQILTSRES